MSRPAKQANCHPDRKHRSSGLCDSCYTNHKKSLRRLRCMNSGLTAAGKPRLRAPAGYRTPRSPRPTKLVRLPATTSRREYWESEILTPFSIEVLAAVA
jgi:hypothetical protein